MSIKNKIKGIKKAAVMAALGAASIGAPLKTQASETTPDKEAITATTDGANTRKQQFEAAVRANLPAEEIAKFVDFPAGIPTTKDGQFDQKKAQEISEKLTPYVKALREKGDSITAMEAYQAYKESMGETNLSFEDFEQVRKVAYEAALKAANKAIPKILLTLPFLFAGLGLAVRMGQYLAEDIKYRGAPWQLPHAFRNDLFSTPSILAAASLLIGGLGITSGIKDIKHLEKNLPAVYQAMYDGHLKSAIEQQQKEFKVLEWDETFSKVTKVKSVER